MYLGKEINLKVFSDLDQVNNEDNYYSIISYFFKIAGGFVFQILRCQKTVVILFIKIKYIILLKVVYEFKWIIEFIKDLDFQIQFLIIIYYNNKNIITIAEIKGIKHHRQIKYINVWYHYIKERMEAGEIQLVYIPIG